MNIFKGAPAMEEGLVGSLEKSPMAASPSASTFVSGTTQAPNANKSGCLHGLVEWFSTCRSAVLGATRLRSKTPSSAVFVRKLDSCPKGYPNVAAFLDSDESFMIYRRFGFLSSRLLLAKQAELQFLEKKLDQLDQSDERGHPQRLHTIDLKEEDAAPRRELLKLIEERYRDYASLVAIAQQMVSCNKPAKCDYRSVVNFMDDNKPLIAKDARWIENREDMITLRPGREHAWLDSTIEHSLKWVQCKIGAKKLIEFLFCSEESKQKSTSLAIYYARDRIEGVASGIIIVAILALLIIPIYLLYHLVADVHTSRSYAICIGILLVFTLTFSTVLSFCTRARRHEILGAAAAYCAVLVVFLGNINVPTK